MVENMRSPLLGIVAVAAAIMVAPTGSASATNTNESVVRTESGPVRGTVAADHRTFQGIPFAAPPVGDLRWRAPRPAAPWTRTRDATRPGDVCPQLDRDHLVVGGEDCLFVNVDTPRGNNTRLPVIVFLHGGGFVGGHPAAYDPTRIVVPGRVVLVTAGYRLGALGFLDHPAMDDPYAGNFGLADQQAALRWVRRNIAAFGGDPGNVTLWGESAGANSTCAQLAAPGARGLFDKAIVQSGPCGNDMLARPVARRRAVDTAAALGCRDVACLRAKPFAELTGLHDDQVTLHRRIAELPWFPVAGTPALPLQPLTAFTLGLTNPVPLIQGGTRDEARAFVVATYDPRTRPITAAEYPKLVREMFGERDSRAILARYPLDRFPTPILAFATLLSDYGGMAGTCTQLPANDAAARRTPVYAYEFAEPTGQVIGDFPLGASHGADVPYFFDGRFPGQPPNPPTGGRKVLADKLIGYWTRFAHTGSPGPDWPAYRHGIALSFAVDRIAPVDVARNHDCGFWRSKR